MIEHFKTRVSTTLGEAEAASPAVLCLAGAWCHGCFAGGAEHELKSLKHPISPITPSDKQQLSTPAGVSCAYSLPTTAFTRTQKVLLALPHKLPDPSMLPRIPNLAVRQQNDHTPFSNLIPFTAAKTNQPHAQLLAIASADGCFRPPTRISSSPQTSGYRIHTHPYLLRLPHWLHSSRIDKASTLPPPHAWNGLTVFSSLSKLPLRPNNLRFSSCGAISKHIWHAPEARQTPLVFPCFPVVRQWPSSRCIQSGQRSAHSQGHRRSNRPACKYRPIRDAPTCTGPRVIQNIEHTPFSTPTAFILANYNQPQVQLLAQGAASGCLRRRVASYHVQKTAVIEHFKTLVNITFRRAEAASPACLCLGCLGAMDALRAMLGTN